MDIAISFYDIEIEDTVRSVNATTIMDRCFNDAPGLASPFCARVERDTTGAIPDNLNFISTVDASFLNLGLATSRGMDVNTRLSTSWDILGGIDITWTQQFTKQLEADEQVFSDDLVEDRVGEFGLPEIRYNTAISLIRGQWEVLVMGRYIDDTEAGLAASLSGNCGVFSITQSLVGSPLTRPTCSAPAAWFWDASLTYVYDETMVITAGINNIDDEEPPFVSLGAGSNRGGRVVSSGYDQYGRSWFVNFTKSF